MLDAKLRQQGSTTRAVLVFIRTSLFRNDPPYSASTIYPLLHATDHTSTLTQAAWAALGRIYRPGFNYVKAGVCLLELETPSKSQQAWLFDEPSMADQQRSTAIMQVMDQINQRFGRHTLGLATELTASDAPWLLKQQRKTPSYTTNWADIVEVGP